MRWLPAFLRWRRFEPSPARKAGVVDTPKDDEARQALERAKQAKARAHVSLKSSQAAGGEMRRELATNHFAQDIYDSFRRKR